MVTQEQDKIFARANDAAKAYALTTTNKEHAQALLEVARQSQDVEYTKLLEARVAKLVRVQ